MRIIKSIFFINCTFSCRFCRIQSRKTQMRRLFKGNYTNFVVHKHFYSTNIKCEHILCITMRYFKECINVIIFPVVKIVKYIYKEAVLSPFETSVENNNY